MSRYPGRTKTSLIERDFPHRVEMIVPEGGFVKRLDQMYAWHLSRIKQGSVAVGVINTTATM